MSPVEPTRDEKEYFLRLEAEQKAKLRDHLEQKEDEKAAQELRDLHYMRCSKCGNEMVTVNFRGIAIERCVCCKGVYLDKGELEKLAGEDEGGMVRVLGSLFGV